MELITKRFKPMGGVMRPISILMVNTTANQYGSKPALTTMGYNSGADITITATGGKNSPATNKNTLMSPISAQRLISMVAIVAARLWVIYSEESAKAKSSAEAIIIMIMTLSRMAEPKIGTKSLALKRRDRKITTIKVNMAPAPAAPGGVDPPPSST